MKVLIIGGVAAGTKTAAKLKREDRNSEVVIYTAGKDIFIQYVRYLSIIIILQTTHFVNGFAKIFFIIGKNNEQNHSSLRYEQFLRLC